MTTRQERLLRILTKLAQRYAIFLLSQQPQNIEKRLTFLADGLAKNGVLVIGSDFISGDSGTRVNQMVEQYAHLYNLLTHNLFPSFTQLEAKYADNQQPPMILLIGESSAVITVLGSYVVPYVAIKQRDKLVSDMELRGVMAFILDALEAGDLPKPHYDSLWQQGMGYLRNLVQLPVRQVALTSFARPLFQEIQQQTGKPPLPPEMPAPKADDPLTATQQLFTVNIPTNPAADLARRRKSQTNDNGRKPPVRVPPFLRDTFDTSDDE